MTLISQTVSPSPSPPAARLTVLPDPPQSPDMALQIPFIARANLILEAHYRSRPDVVVISDGYLCLEAGNARRSPSPDCLVSFGMTLPKAEIMQSNGYTISEIGKPPEFVLEIASASTGRRDYTVKRDIYASYGVPEYWRFDHTGGQYHDTALAGDRLLPNGEYEPIPVTTLPNGVIRGYSAVLGLELRSDAGNLRFWNPSTGEYLPDLMDAMDQRDAEAAAHQITTAQRDAEAAARQAEAAAHQITTARLDAEAAAHQVTIAQRDAEAAARQAATEARQAEAVARQAAEERIRQLEAQLAQRRAEN